MRLIIWEPKSGKTIRGSKLFQKPSVPFSSAVACLKNMAREIPKCMSSDEAADR